MRLQVILLLALVSMFSGGAPATARSNRDNASTKGFLRTDDDNGEERAVKFEGLAKLFKPPLTPAERRAAELAKLAKMKDLTKAFKYLKLNKFKSVKLKELKLEDVDKLFASEKYKVWAIHLARWNQRQPKEKHFNVAKMFNQELGSEKAFKVFNIASTSANPTVKTLGDTFQVLLLRQLANAGGDYKKIQSIAGSDEVAAKWLNLVLQSSSEHDQQVVKRFAAPLLRKWAEHGNPTTRL